MLTFLAVGGFWFWSIVALSMMVMMAGMEYENGTWTTGTFLITTTLLVLANKSILTFLASLNPINILLITLSYFVLGTVWAVVKWWFYVKKGALALEQIKREYLLKYNVKSISELPDRCQNEYKSDAKDEFNNIYNFHYSSDNIKPPLVSNKKSTIMLWMSYWPVSAIWTLLNDPVKHVFKQIYYRISSLLQEISNNAYKNVEF